MDADLWTVAEAKAKLRQLIDEAQKRGPQTITKNGRRTVVWSMSPSGSAVLVRLARYWTSLKTAPVLHQRFALPLVP